MTKKILFIITAITCFLFILNSAVYCNSANKPVNPGNNPVDPPNNPADSGATNAPLDIFAAKGIKSGLIKVNKNIFCLSDTLDISVVFPKSLKAFWDGSADAYFVLKMPETVVEEPEDKFLVVQFEKDDEVPDKPKQLVSFVLPEDGIPEGEYQIAMILVNPGGEALNLSDWYNGFNGLISVTKFTYKVDCDPKDDMTTDPLEVDPQSAELKVGETVDITISGGTGDYSAASDEESIASVTVNGNTASVTGVQASDNPVTITITDTDNETASVSIFVD